MNSADGLDPVAVRRQFRHRGARLSEADYLYREVERKMLERLEVVRLVPERIVDLGCGLGNGLMAARQRFAQAHLVGIDIAHSVLCAAAQRTSPLMGGFLGRLAASARVQRKPLGLINADVQELPLPAASVDLLWSNLCLHWLDRPAVAFADWYRVVRPGGLLMFSAFGVDTLKELRGDDNALMEFADMHDIGDALVEAGFADPVMDLDWISVSFDDPEKLLTEIHALGGNASRRRRKSLLGRGQRDQWLDRMLRQRDSDGRMLITFEIVYGHAWCPETKRRADGLSPIAFRPR